MAEKARYWTAVCYPENMLPDWQKRIDDLLEFPFAYCVHDLDHDSKSDHRKDHVHILIAWPNTTTAKACKELVDRLAAPGRKCCPAVQAVHDIRRCYDYLIHDTESCEKAGKEKYDPALRITGNNFDIGLYEQISTEDKSEALRVICDYVVQANIQNFADIYLIVSSSEDFSEMKYWEAMKTYSSMIERVCKGLYLKQQQQKEKE